MSSATSTAASVFRTPDERYASLPDFPYEPRYLELDGGVRLAYVDEGSGPPVLLLHGEPTWSFLYRKIIPVLRAAGLRAIAPDYVGFGRSDKWTDLSAYSFEGHVRSIQQLVQSLDLRDVTLVVHDWGGPIGLRVATLDPARFSRLIVLNTGLYTPWRGLPGGLRRWRDFAAAQADLEVGAVVGRACIRPLAPEAAAAYDAPFPTRASRAGARAFPLLIPESETDPGARQMIEVLQRLRTLKWPVLVLWGERDPIFPPEAGKYVTALFSGCDLHLLEDAGHFPQEDRGPDVAARIVDFVRNSW